MSEKTIEHKKEVQKYYGEILKSSKDLQTNACCTAITYPNHIKNALKNIHPEVIEKYYGCGLCVPENLDGCTVLDLGSGSGRDCYLLSQLVGSKGSVVGVDMTKEQLAIANKHLDFHATQFGYQNSNVTFLEGDMVRA